MAEALLRRIDSEHFEASSAGIELGPINALADEAMKEIGLSIERKTPMCVRDLQSPDYDFVITLCEHAKLNCPDVGLAERIHWNLEDPLASPDLERQSRAFRALRDQISQRLHLFALVQSRTRNITPSIRLEQPDRSVSPTLH
jgi:ArsR family transcriptional regulator